MYGSGTRPSLASVGLSARARHWWRRHEVQYRPGLSIAQVALLALFAVVTLVLVAYAFKHG